MLSYICRRSACHGTFATSRSNSRSAPVSQPGSTSIQAPRVRAVRCAADSGRRPTSSSPRGLSSNRHGCNATDIRRAYTTDSNVRANPPGSPDVAGDEVGVVPVLLGEQAVPVGLAAADAGDLAEVLEPLNPRRDHDQGVRGVVRVGAEGVVAP